MGDSFILNLYEPKKHSVRFNVQEPPNGFPVPALAIYLLRDWLDARWGYTGNNIPKRWRMTLEPIKEE